MNLNPNHPTTQALDGNWHKIVAILLVKHGINHTVITLDDLKTLDSGGAFMTVQELPDGIHLRLVDEETAHRLARENGGLPI